MDMQGSPALAPKSNRGLIIWQAALAGLASFGSAAAFSDSFGLKVAGMYMAMMGALQTATALYVAAAKPIQAFQAPPSGRG